LFTSVATASGSTHWSGSSNNRCSKFIELIVSGTIFAAALPAKAGTNPAADAHGVVRL
jgi:hypothetical protein